MGEWPLIIFTVLSQLVAGAIVTLWLLDQRGKITDFKKGKLIVASLFIIMGIGLLASLLHLGHPFQAYRALTHFSNSWLSREVILFSLLLGLLVLYFFKWSSDNHQGRSFIGGITALVALLALLSSAMVYSVPARPAWDSLFPTFFFVMTAALLGPLYVNLFLKFEEITQIKFTTVLGIGALVSVIGFALYVSSLLGGVPESYQSGMNFITGTSFWLRILLGWLIPMALIYFSHVKKAVPNQSTLLVLFVLILAGEILGRELFYYATVALNVAGL